MWRTSFFLSLVLLLVLPLTFSYSEEPLLIYPSELKELTEILQSLENKNLTLEAELKTVQASLLQWEQTYTALNLSWSEYKTETQLLLRKKDIIIVVLAITSCGLLGGLIF